ncbi:MAG: beta-L-arabinofuranosidase domain-containing protein [Planctomycetota bacterium]
MLLALLLSLAIQDPPRPLAPVPFEKVHLRDSFFAPRIEINRKVTIEACLKKCEETGRIRNFAVAGGILKGEHEGLLYNDSDLYKLIEGIAYSLQASPDPKLEARTDVIIDWIAAAQREDGYLNTYWQLVQPDKKWTNIRHGHELYCAGHLIEAAVAYEAATGKKKLLETALKLVAHIDREFGWGRHQEPTGHPELELALMKLWRRTGEERWLKLASFFVDVRGKQDRGTALFGEYAQDHAPVRAQREVVGHAVRAMYLYSGMADVAAASGDRTLLAPLEGIWNELVQRKLYVTGGIGSSGSNEGFSVPYDLPNDSAYCETCAAIGMGMWNQRMFLLTRQTKYADMLEREVYNNIPAGVSLGGDRFFYDNPLASRGDKQRVPWFDCSCCPSNIVRYLPAMGERIYAVSGADLFVVLYAASSAEVEVAGTKLKISQDTDYPVSGTVKIAVEPAKPARFALHLRVPDWCKEPRLVAPADSGARRQTPGADEYVIDREWRAGDVVTLELPMSPRRIHADPKVEADVGRVAISRGPLVYCFEAADNGGSARNLALPEAAALSSAWESALLGGTTVLRATGEAVSLDDLGKRIAKPARLVAIPYSSWNNRGGEGTAGEMVVWIPEAAGLAELPGQGFRVEQDGLALTASHCWSGDTLLALIDGRLPSSSSDDSIPRMTFWDHRGSAEWIEMDFDKPRKLAKSSVYWFDDTGRGNCRLPESWRLAWKDGEAWKPVVLSPGSSYGVGKDAFAEISFEPVETSALRVEIQLRKEFSAGVLEWKVE